MKTSPFTFGHTVSGKFFTDRKQDKLHLYSNLTNNINTMIISPRRWGKSSLVEEVFKEIKHKNKKIIPVSIDLFSVADETEFLERFSREVIKASSSKWEDWVKSTKEFFKGLSPVISLGSDPLQDFSIQFNIQNLTQQADEILNLPEIIAKNKKIKFVIGLDEFQNLSNFNHFETLEKKMRAVWQRQKSVTYCLYGSKRHMMSEIFNNSSKPFYRFGDVMLLQKIPQTEWKKYIVRKFNQTGKVISKDLAGKIADKMEQHSWYVQQYAHYVWIRTGKEVDETILKQALDEIIAVNKPFFQNTMEQLSQTQINLLKAIADNQTKLTAASVMQKYKLGTPRNVSKNKQILLKNDIIEIQPDKSIIFLDPVFKIWFLNEFVK